MHKFSIRLIAPLLLLLSTASIADDFDRARPERLGMSSDRLERLDAVLKSYVDNDQLAGQVVLVLRKGRIAYSNANGMQDIAAGIPMAPVKGVLSEGKRVGELPVVEAQPCGEVAWVAGDRVEVEQCLIHPSPFGVQDPLPFADAACFDRALHALCHPVCDKMR